MLFLRAAKIGKIGDENAGFWEIVTGATGPSNPAGIRNSGRSVRNSIPT